MKEEELKKETNNNTANSDNNVTDNVHTISNNTEITKGNELVASQLLNKAIEKTKEDQEELQNNPDTNSTHGTDGNDMAKKVLLLSLLLQQRKIKEEASKIKEENISSITESDNLPEMMNSPETDEESKQTENDESSANTTVNTNSSSNSSSGSSCGPVCTNNLPIIPPSVLTTNSATPMQPSDNISLNSGSIRLNLEAQKYPAHLKTTIGGANSNTNNSFTTKPLTPPQDAQTLVEQSCNFSTDCSIVITNNSLKGGGSIGSYQNPIANFSLQGNACLHLKAHIYTRKLTMETGSTVENFHLMHVIGEDGQEAEMQLTGATSDNE